VGPRTSLNGAESLIPTGIKSLDHYAIPYMLSQTTYQTYKQKKPIKFDVLSQQDKPRKYSTSLSHIQIFALIIYFANINSAATQDTYIKSNCHGNTAMSSSDC